jgi:hypothetical protein
VEVARRITFQNSTYRRYFQYIQQFIESESNKYLRKNFRADNTFELNAGRIYGTNRKGGFISAHQDSTDETEEKSELTKAIRCIPIDVKGKKKVRVS